MNKTKLLKTVVCLSAFTSLLVKVNPQFTEKDMKIFYLCMPFPFAGKGYMLSHCSAISPLSRHSINFVLGAAVNHLHTTSPVAKLTSTGLTGCFRIQLGFQTYSGCGAWLSSALLPANDSPCDTITI